MTTDDVTRADEQTTRTGSERFRTKRGKRALRKPSEVPTGCPSPSLADDMRSSPSSNLVGVRGRPRELARVPASKTQASLLATGTSRQGYLPDLEPILTSSRSLELGRFIASSISFITSLQSKVCTFLWTGRGSKSGIHWNLSWCIVGGQPAVRAAASAAAAS